MLKAVTKFKSRSANDAQGAGFRRSIIVSTALVLALTLATTVATTYLVGDFIRRTTEEDLQARTTALARTID